MHPTAQLHLPAARFYSKVLRISSQKLPLSNELSSGETCPSLLLVIKTDSVAETLWLNKLKTRNNVQNCIHVLISGRPLPYY
jgi:hypothetical protein